MTWAGGEPGAGNLAVIIDDYGEPGAQWDRVVEFILSEDHRTVKALEMCDEWFSAALDRRQMGLLIDYLTALRDQMPDVAESAGMLPHVDT